MIDLPASIIKNLKSQIILKSRKLIKLSLYFKIYCVKNSKNKN